MKDHPLVRHFTNLVDSWSAAGWGEYLLHEVLEGKRDRPFKYLDPLPSTDLEVCQRLRDELKVWPYWDGATGTWDVVSINVWRTHMAETSADEVRNRIQSIHDLMRNR